MPKGGFFMPRKKRIFYPGALYHVMSRGNDKKPIFKTKTDRIKFLKYLEWQHINRQARIHGYCLMGNHYHLILETPLANISKIMQELQGSYAIYFNIKYKSAGHLFQGRYKAKIVERETYLRQLSRYVHRNPLEAGRQEMMYDYLWSSYVYFIHKIRAPRWLAITDVMGLFDHDSESYKNFVEKQCTEDTSFQKMVKKGDFICSESFLEKIRSKRV